MNFLAHAFLGFDQEERRVGQIAGDFIKGRDLSVYPKLIAEGVQLHRRLDVWTDQQPVFRRSCARFPVSRRRVAGILVDLLYDHALARSWSSYCNIGLAQYTEGLYDALQRHQPVLPDNMASFIARAPSVGIFEGYVEFSAMERAVGHIATRMKTPGLFDGALQEMLTLTPEIDKDFDEFFPQAILKADALLPENFSLLLNTDHCIRESFVRCLNKA